MIVVGVDGCPGGWVAIRWDVDGAAMEPVIHASLAELLACHHDAAAIGIDILIGLSDSGTRACDVAARRLLGPRRASSVFPPPVRDILEVGNYSDVVAASRALIGKGISRQAFAIFSRIAEANRLITPEMQDRVVEVHPEVSFRALAGEPMTHRKSRATGYDERRTHLERATRVSLPDRRDAFAWARPAKPDDLLDAAVGAWSAWRLANGVAGRLPAQPEIDAAGLRVEIVY